MISVAVISSLVARFRRCQEILESKGPMAEDGRLLNSLMVIKELLLDIPLQKQEEGAEFVVLEKKIVNLSYQIVDAITDASLLELKEKSSSNYKRAQRKKSVTNTKLHDLEQDLRVLLDELSTVSVSVPEEKSSTEMKEAAVPPGQKSLPESEIEEVQEDKEEEMLNRVRAELLNPDSTREVYLVGESGMGKTSVARRLFYDYQLREHFDVFGWVTINPKFRIKSVLRDLLQQLGTRQEREAELSNMDEIELITWIFDALENKRYLLVLDDIETVDEWKSICLALPTAYSGSRVIITTSSSSVVAAGALSYEIGLTQTEMFDLLKKEASFQSGIHSEKVGEAIYDISGGSPLFATILGRSLQSEANEQQLLGELHSHLPHRGTPRVLGICYRRLAPELKSCLLYMAQFPQGHDIEVDKLCLLLAAEDLIMSPKVSHLQSLSEYLDRLAYFKLVQLQEDHMGAYKSCRLHHSVWKFCKDKASEEVFLEIVDFGSQSRQQVGPETRRLALLLNSDSKSVLQHIRLSMQKKLLTLVILSTFDIVSRWSTDATDFLDLNDSRYLRVLSFDGVDIRSGKFTKGLERLLFLRFLSFQGCIMKELPSSLIKLTQLESLNLLVTDRIRVIITNDIFANMNRMVHLYLPRKYRKAGTTKLSLRNMVMLETLVNFNTEVFDLNDLHFFPSLKILSIITNGEVQDLGAVVDILNEQAHRLHHSSVEIKRFNCYRKNSVSELKRLLRCQFVHSIHIDGLIVKLPEEDEDDDDGSSSRCSEMVFDGSLLEHDPLPYLGKFRNLRSLLLSNDAFIGDYLLIPAVPLFPKLRSLKLQNLPNLEKLTIEKGAVPELSTLHIRDCGGSLEPTIPKPLYSRLESAVGGNAFSVTPWPRVFRTTI